MTDPHHHRVALIATLFAFFHVTECRSQSETPSVPQVKSISTIDFAFDGGSILIGAVDNKDSAVSLLIVKPTSPLMARCSGDFPILIGRKAAKLTSEGVQPGKVELDTLIKHLITAGVSNRDKAGRRQQHDAVISVLLAIRCGHPVTKWGHDAVTLLSAGDWVPLFADADKASPTGVEPGR